MQTLPMLRAALAASVLFVPVAAQTVPCFDTSLGTNLGLADDGGASGLQLGFSFAFGGQNYTDIAVCSNGFLWLGTPPVTNPWDYSPTVAELLGGQPRICPLWTDFNPAGAGSGQVWFNAVPAGGGNPGRAVITWDHVFEYQRTNPITMQCQLIDDGRIIFFYDPSIPVVLGGISPGSQLMGMSPGGNAQANAVTWSAVPLNLAGPTAHQMFTTGQFNLIGRSRECVPAGPGYTVIDRPQCQLSGFVKTGNGCPHDLIFYEAFGIVDLANSSIRFVPSGGGYSALPGPGLDTGYTTPLLMGDDTINTMSLPFSFPFAGNNLTSVAVCSNGYLWMGTGVASIQAQSLPFVTGAARVAPLWADLNPAAGGQTYMDTSAQRAMVTWINVPEYGQANANTLQVKLLPSGEIIFSYGALAIAAHPALTGITQGAASDPGAMDVSASVPFQTGAPGAVPLSLDAAVGSRPSIGTTFSMNVGSVPANAILAALLIGFTAANNDLAGLGMPTCRGYLNPATAVSMIGLASSGVATFNLALPNNPGLLGVVAWSQGAAFSPGSNALGVITSNGGRITVGL